MSFAREAHNMLLYGKRYMLEETEKCKDSYLKRAARLYATTDGGERKSTLMWWWTEGIRDYCESNRQIEDIRELLRDEAINHITQGRY